MINKLYKLADDLIEPISTEEAYQKLVNVGKRLFGARSGSLFLYRDGELVRVYASARLLKNVKPRKRGFIYTAYRRKTPIFIADEELKESHPELYKKGIRFVLIIPLHFRSISLGVMTFQIKDKIDVTNEVTSVAKIFSSIATLTLQKATHFSELSRALRMRDTFIRMAAHELKTPLTTIEGYSGLLHKKYDNDEQLTPILRAMNAESKRMIYLVEELLTVNHIESGRITYEFEIVSLRNLYEHITRAFRGAYPLRKLVDHIELHPRHKGLLICDWKKIVQVCMNVLTNAVKYSPNHSDIVFHVRKEEELYVLQVSDQGVGIEESELPHIFEGFYKGKDSPSGSMGVGLYLAREIVHAHQGMIDVESVRGEGTSIFIRLPVYT